VDYTITSPPRSRPNIPNNEDLESANSSIIGVLLLITIVMVMGGIVSLVLTSQPLPDKVPIAYLSVSQSHERVELSNKAGDTLSSKSIAIVVDGVDRTNEFRKPENTLDWGTLHTGEHIYYDSPQEPKSVQVLYVGNSGKYLLASSGPATDTPITIIPSPTPVPTIPVAATPTVLQIIPGSGYNNTSVNIINVTGTAFLNGATIKLNGTGFSDIPATDVTVVSPEQITCSFNLSGLPAGFRNVVVTNSDGNNGMLAGGFRVDHAGIRSIADFVATPTNGTAPLTVQFNDTSTNSMVSWAWTFGDGGISNIQNAIHQYTNPGTYTVNLTVTNADGSDCKIKTNYIIVTSKNSITSQNLVANFTSNVTQIPVNGFVQFYDNSTNSPTRWQWTFGDDLFYDTHQNPVHQYINPGVFSVHLTVTNADGSASEIKTKYIQVMKVNHAPVLTQITNQTTTVGIPLTFIVTASDLDNDRLTYSAGGLPTGATFDPATRTFAWTPLDGMAGNYSVTFTVSDGALTDSETNRIMVNSRPKIPPTAQFTANTVQGQAPLTLQFTDRSVSAGTTSYQWDMNNDGVVDYTTRNPGHTYQTSGTYTVKLTVTNASGSDSEIKTNYIKVSSPEVVSSSTLYLTDFGIKGDGSDETAKLKSAFDYAASHSIKAIVFPAGKTIGINNYVETPENLEYIGNGCTIKLINNAVINHENCFIYFHAGSYVHNLIFDGNDANQGGTSTNGIMLYTNDRFENNEVKNVGAYSIYTYTGDNILINNNVVHDSRQYGIATSGEGFPSVSDYSNNITITNNIIYNCGQVGIKIRQTSNSLVKGNIITIPTSRYDDAPTGIRLYSFDGANHHITITNNQISGPGDGSIAISSDDSANSYISITNNQVTNANTGIKIKFNNGIITGNSITYRSTCIANSGSGNTVSGNSCN